MWSVSPKKDKQWLFIGQRDGVFGLHKCPAEEMIKKVHGGELKNNTLIRPETDDELHSFGEWRKICGGLNPFLISCNSFNEMRKITVPSGKLDVNLFRHHHPILPLDAVLPYRQHPIYYNRAPRQIVLSGSDGHTPDASSSGNTNDSTFYESSEENYYNNFNRHPSLLTSNFIATLEESPFSRKDKYFAKTARNLQKKSSGSPKRPGDRNGKSSKPIQLTIAEAARLLSEVFGFQVEIVQEDMMRKIQVNNAGSLAPDNTKTLGFNQSMEEWDFTMDLNLKSVAQLSRLAMPHQIKTKGSIVNVSSIGSTNYNATFPYYCVAKAGVDHLTRCLAMAFIEKGVNAVNNGGRSMARSPL